MTLQRHMMQSTLSPNPITTKGGERGENQTPLLIFEYYNIFFSKKALFNEHAPTILQLVVD